MKQYHFTQHIPGFVTGVEPSEFTFSDISELLSHFKLGAGHVFSCDVPSWTCDDERELDWARHKSNVYFLMDSTTYKKWWWVIGYTDFPLDKYLPLYNRIKTTDVVIDINCSDQEILDFVQGRLRVLKRNFKPRCALPCVVRLVASNKRIIAQCTLTEVKGSEWVLTESKRIEDYQYVEKRFAKIRYAK